MKEIKGDLIKLAQEKKFDIIVHGCNCFCTMNSGIAAQIKRTFPVAYVADQGTNRGDIRKLGDISASAAILGDHFLCIINAYTQYEYGTDKRYVDYAALRACFAKIAKIGKHKKIAYPKIGAGLAGGDWEKIKCIIDEELIGLDHTLVVWEK